MNNEYSNLIPFSQMDAERHRELSVKGGISSGAARRKKKTELEAEVLKAKAQNEVFRATLKLIHELAQIS